MEREYAYMPSTSHFGYPGIYSGTIKIETGKKLKHGYGMFISKYGEMMEE